MHEPILMAANAPEHNLIVGAGYLSKSVFIFINSTAATLSPRGTFQELSSGGYCAWCTSSCATWIQGQPRASAAHKQIMGFWKIPGGGGSHSS